MPTFLLLLLFSLNLITPSKNSCLPPDRFEPVRFAQKSDRFIRFSEEKNSWVELKLPYEVVSCNNGGCIKVGEIGKTEGGVDRYDRLVAVRRRVSLTKMSEVSVWVTGESGAIYERFWNGVEWVIVPHDLPVQGGPAVSVFFVNQSVLALSQSGLLYQMQLNENSQPNWVEFPATFENDQNSAKAAEAITQIKSGVVSHTKERVYFCTKGGSLLELAEVETPRWMNHKRPPGGDVAAIADVATLRPDVVFTISSEGDLYEHDKNSKPPWKKHVWADKSVHNISLMPAKGCCLQGLHGPYSMSLFLITKAGALVERRLHQRKWRWVVHESPEEHLLTSITPVLQEPGNENSYSLFLTTATGSVLECQITKHSGDQELKTPETWIDHLHPPQAKAAKGIVGLPYQVGRTIYPLDDGRLAELHLSGARGQNSGPSQVGIRRKVPRKYTWTVLEAPESEGWNGEYCTEERGPSNCISGINSQPNDLDNTRFSTRRRKGKLEEQTYLIPNTTLEYDSREGKFKEKWVKGNFRLRVMHKGRSFFVVGGGVTMEYVSSEGGWVWLHHEHEVKMKGVVGSYNASLFVVDVNGDLMIRERVGGEEERLGWVNCTSLRKGRQVVGGAPWDEVMARAFRGDAEDALFFVGKTGRLLQFTVAERNYTWKDCKSPANTKVTAIVDQEGFRENIVFVVGRNGRLYQYNRLTGLWHQHHQSQHLVLSNLPGTAMRPSPSYLKGSLFMIDLEGGLVEYHWSTQEGWSWFEHGTPHGSVSFVAGPGPGLEGNQLLLVGSDGRVYLRYCDEGEWRWKDYGYPSIANMAVRDGKEMEREGFCEDDHRFTARSEDGMQIDLDHVNRNCDPRVTDTRPIPFSEDSVIFELRDGRLAEIRRTGKSEWAWLRTIASPTSLCMANYWTAPAA